MNRKGLELPMNTIVIMVMVLFVLIGLGIFFFQQFGASKTQGFDQSQCVSICQTAKSVHASQLPTGLHASDAAAKNYCNSCPDGVCALDDTGTQLGCKGNVVGGSNNNLPS
ncbi:MAG: hypothetical protein PHH61_05550 [Candidatus Nanoarchaeia archaeon]|nr:hypothetical protein [Candidatus Nanoarchaeia archaeon]